MSKSVSSSIHIPEEKKITYNYTDGTSEVVYLDEEIPLENDFVPFSIPNRSLASGIDKLTEELEQTQKQRKEEGRCVSCGELLEMTIYGLKDCGTCSN